MAEITRRAFLKLTGYGGVAAAAGELGTKAAQSLIPYLVPPGEAYKPGTWNMFATTCRECPAGCGLHMRYIDGRVTKCEGNGEHPINRGGLCARGQSAVQGLYDPDRIKKITCRLPSDESLCGTWDEALAQISKKLTRANGRVALISDLQTGALAEVMLQFVRAFGSDRLAFHEAFTYEPLRAAHGELFGLPVIPRYRLDTAEYVVSFGADFLETWISPVEFARDFVVGQAYRNADKTMGRFVYVGPHFSMTAANADDYIQASDAASLAVAVGMLKAIIANGWGKADTGKLRAKIESLPDPAGGYPAGLSPEKVSAMARAFVQARGSVALACPVAAHGPLATQIAFAAGLLNYAAGRIGQTVDFAQPHALSQTTAELRVDQLLHSLGSDDVLIIHNTNHAFCDREAASRIAAAGTVVYLGTMMDETAELAHYVLPTDYPLESWGDYEPYAGTHCINQPTMSRMYDTRNAGDILLAMMRNCELRIANRKLTTATTQEEATRGQDARDTNNNDTNSNANPQSAIRNPQLVDFESFLRNRWDAIGRRIYPGLASDVFWKNSLIGGGAWEPPADVDVKLNLDAKVDLSAPKFSPAGKNDFDVWVWPSIFLFDGRGANRGWLQESPDPMTSIVWGSWVEMHPTSAAALGFAENEIIAVRPVAAVAGGDVAPINAPLRITEDIAPGTLGMPIGQGHTALGANAKNRGANAFNLLGCMATHGIFGRVSVSRSGGNYTPVVAQPTQQQFGRGIVEWVGLSKLQTMSGADGEKLQLPLPEGYSPEENVIPGPTAATHRWSIVVDLKKCIGCGACAVACYAENNVPVVGQLRVRQGREMAWLKVVPYRKTGGDGKLAWLPLMCHQCDSAPCESVCPVFASVHSEEGLNAQVYNRCIGTRYCSNNCPYKVRRFNWENIEWPRPLDWQLNPEVSVRCRGVMEKCTFCIQRIKHAELDAKRDGRRKLRDGEFTTACAQSCPTGAIVFGDLMDPSSRVSQITGCRDGIAGDPRRYHLLENLSTKPAVTYLKRIDNDE